MCNFEAQQQINKLINQQVLHLYLPSYPSVFFFYYLQAVCLSCCPFAFFFVLFLGLTLHMMLALRQHVCVRALGKSIKWKWVSVCTSLAQLCIAVIEFPDIKHLVLNGAELNCCVGLCVCVCNCVTTSYILRTIVSGGACSCLECRSGHKSK